MKDLMPEFEGKPKKSKNPYPENNPARAAWLVARLGGWKGFAG